MTARVGEVIAELKANPPPLPVGEIAEAVQFLEWLVADNFTFLGIRNYQFTAGGDALEPVFASGLGVLRARGVRRCSDGTSRSSSRPRSARCSNEPTLLIVTKSSVRSRVHRRVYMDYVGVKRFDRRRQADRRIPHRRPVHLHRLYALDPLDPVSAPQGRSGRHAAPASISDGHSGKALVNVLENYPRDELFQIDEDTLHHFALAVLQLDERPRVRVLPRRDRFDRFVSVLVYVPRDRYDSGVRKLIGDYLADAYKGRVSAFHPFFPGGAAGPRPFHHRASGGRGVATGSRQPRARRSRRSCGPGPTSSPPRSRRPTSRSRRGPCSSAIATRSRTAIARPIRRRPPSTTSASSRDCRRRGRSASISTAAPATTPAASG